MHPLIDLTGKIAIVTGATRGLGRSIAETFLMAGASVCISSEDANACRDVESQLRSAGHLRVFALHCDVTNVEQQHELVKATSERFGGVDILVANAGISDASRGTLPFEGDTYERVLEVNLHSVRKLCGIVVPELNKRGGGSIILMSSLSAMRGNKAIGAYALAKAALAQLARNIAVEFGPLNIRANALAPGFIRTELSAALMSDAAFMGRRMQNTPLRRPGEPHEVAGPALLLAAAGGAFITGQTLVIDGGTLITDGN